MAVNSYSLLWYGGLAVSIQKSCTSAFYTKTGNIQYLQRPTLVKWQLWHAIVNLASQKMPFFCFFPLILIFQDLSGAVTTTHNLF